MIVEIQRGNTIYYMRAKVPAKQKLDIGYLEKVAGVRRPCLYCYLFFPNRALISHRWYC